MTIKRKLNRLSGYNYASIGAYFVTIKTHDSESVFGEIHVRNGRDRSVVKLNQCGLIVEQQWKWLFQQYKYIKSDEYIVMPDHFHGILFIDPVGIRYNRDRSLRGAFFILTSPCHYVNADIVYKFSNPPKGQGCLTLK